MMESRSSSGGLLPTRRGGLHRLYIGLAAVGIVIAGALYLERMSRRWVPDAEARLRAATEAQAQQAAVAVADEALKNPGNPEAQLAYARELTARHEYVAALRP